MPIDEVVSPRTGLTAREDTVMGHLAEAFNGFIRLEAHHPSEQEEFAAAIHRCQDLLAVRIARRRYPDGWPVAPTPAPMRPMSGSTGCAALRGDKQREAERLCTKPWTVNDNVPYCDFCGLFRQSVRL
jgi:hypothetical protein